MAKRVQFILLGILGGLAFWGLTEAPEAWRGMRAFLALSVLAASFFTATLAMLGELGLRRALGFAALIGAAAALLALLKSFAFTDTWQMLQQGHVLVALTVICTLPLPFAIAWGLGGRAGWTEYRVLFLEAWNIVVRYAAAWLFVAVVWAVLWLLAMLLRIVGVEALVDLLERPILIWLLVGGSLGLGLSVVTEMSDMVSPYLLLRLLRLLLPLVLVVVLVFVAALPLRGLTHLFGHLSAATILLTTAMAAIGLIAITVDQDDVEAPHAAALLWSGRGLALLLPVLVALAIQALAERVGSYGWTPARVMAATAAGVMAGYAVFYAASVLTGRGWMRWIRRANVVMALAMIGLGVLWMTPAVSPEAIATRSQMARYAAGGLRADQLPLYEMAHDWGRAGAAGVAALRDTAALPGQEALAERLALLDRAASRWDMEVPGAAAGAAPARAEALRAVIRVLPEGAALPEGLLAAIAVEAEDDWAGRCAEPTPAGNPGCVLVLGDFAPMLAGQEALLLRAVDGASRLLAFGEGEGGWQRRTPAFLGAGVVPTGAVLIDALIAGGAQPEPADLQALRAGAWQLTLQP